MAAASKQNCARFDSRVLVHARQVQKHGVDSILSDTVRMYNTKKRIPKENVSLSSANNKQTKNKEYKK